MVWIIYFEKREMFNCCQAFVRYIIHCLVHNFPAQKREKNKTIICYLYVTRCFLPIFQILLLRASLDVFTELASSRWRVFSIRCFGRAELLTKSPTLRKGRFSIGNYLTANIIDKTGITKRQKIHSLKSPSARILVGMVERKFKTVSTASR